MYFSSPKSAALDLRNCSRMLDEGVVGAPKIPSAALSMQIVMSLAGLSRESLHSLREGLWQSDLPTKVQRAVVEVAPNLAARCASALESISPSDLRRSVILCRTCGDSPNAPLAAPSGRKELAEKLKEQRNAFSMAIHTLFNALLLECPSDLAVNRNPDILWAHCQQKIAQVKESKCDLNLRSSEWLQLLVLNLCEHLDDINRAEMALAIPSDSPRLLALSPDGVQKLIEFGVLNKHPLSGTGIMVERNAVAICVYFPPQCELNLPASAGGCAHLDEKTPVALRGSVVSVKTPMNDVIYADFLSVSKSRGDLQKWQMVRIHEFIHAFEGIARRAKIVEGRALHTVERTSAAHVFSELIAEVACGSPTMKLTIPGMGIQRAVTAAIIGNFPKVWNDARSLSEADESALKILSDKLVSQLRQSHRALESVRDCLSEIGYAPSISDRLAIVSAIISLGSVEQIDRERLAIATGRKVTSNHQQALLTRAENRFRHSKEILEALEGEVGEETLSRVRSSCCKVRDNFLSQNHSGLRNRYGTLFKLADGEGIQSIADMRSSLRNEAREIFEESSCLVLQCGSESWVSIARELLNRGGPTDPATFLSVLGDIAANILLYGCGKDDIFKLVEESAINRADYLHFMPHLKQSLAVVRAAIIVDGYSKPCRVN